MENKKRERITSGAKRKLIYLTSSFPLSIAKSNKGKENFIILSPFLFPFLVPNCVLVPKHPEPFGILKTLFFSSLS